MSQRKKMALRLDSQASFTKEFIFTNFGNVDDDAEE